MTRYAWACACGARGRKAFASHDGARSAAIDHRMYRCARHVLGMTGLDVREAPADEDEPP